MARDHMCTGIYHKYDDLIAIVVTHLIVLSNFFERSC